VAKARDKFRIIQLSDLHCGDSRFDKALVDNALEEINSRRPDLVVIPGDLTADGYRDQFEEAREYISQIACPQVVTVAGNHDCRNVGFLHFEDLFGSRNKTVDFDFCVYCEEIFQEKVKVVAVDSNKPDLNDGEVGRGKYDRIREQFRAKNDYKIFVLHHHLVSVPGTGRERNIVWDAGDVLMELRKVEVDLVLAGHRHVPYIWPIAGMLIINSGTVCTWRTRGYTKPSYNIIEISATEIDVQIMMPGGEILNRERYSRVHPKKRLPLDK